MLETDLVHQTMTERARLVDYLVTQKADLGGKRLVLASTDVHEFAKFLLDAALDKAGARVIDAGVNRDPEDIVSAAVESAAEAIVITTHNGVARSFAQVLRAELDKAQLSDLPVFMGGVLNEDIEGSEIPVDVRADLVGCGCSRSPPSRTLSACWRGPLENRHRHPGRQPGRRWLAYMKVALLADFGSTYTKVLAVDLAEGALVGSAQHPTTLTGEILDGYEDAARSALKEVRAPVEVTVELAASSAGGGMRMAAIGLVDSLTAAAAAAAALNAGAKLVGTFTGRLGEHDARRLSELDPEIVLFAGGTDGGQEDLVIRNAEAMATAVSRAHVVVACNQAIAAKVSAVFGACARSVTVVANVLPDIGRTSFGEAREAIAKVFISEVIAGKRLSASPGFARLVQMATPDAVLRGAVAYARTQQAGPATASW